MSPVTLNPSADGRRVSAGKLFEIADSVEILIEQFQEELSVEDWQELNDSVVRLRACANIISSLDQEALLEDEINHVERLMKSAWSKGLPDD